MIPWLLARESRQPFSFWVCESGISDGEFDAVPYFFYCILRHPFVFPSDFSYAKVASGDSNLCMNLG